MASSLKSWVVLTELTSADPCRYLVDWSIVGSSVRPELRNCSNSELSRGYVFTFLIFIIVGLESVCDPVTKGRLVDVDYCLQIGHHEQIRAHLYRKSRSSVKKALLSLLKQLSLSLVSHFLGIEEILHSFTWRRQFFFSEKMVAGPHVIFPTVVVPKEKKRVLLILL